MSTRLNIFSEVNNKANELKEKKFAPKSYAEWAQNIDVCVNQDGCFRMNLIKVAAVAALAMVEANPEPGKDRNDIFVEIRQGLDETKAAWDGVHRNTVFDWRAFILGVATNWKNDEASFYAAMKKTAVLAFDAVLSLDEKVL
jgi:hypothetical protein